MSESSPEMSVRTESASPNAIQAVKACVAELEASGFDRPCSLSPDAYLTALADLNPEWAPDLASLGVYYAERRFGSEGTTVELRYILAACERVAAQTLRLRRSAEIVSLREAWSLRFSMPLVAEDITPVSAESAPSSAEAIDSVCESTPNLRPGLVQFRPGGFEELARRFGERTVSVRTAAGALIASAALASVGTFYLPQALEKIRGAFPADDDIVMLAEAPIAVASSSSVTFGALESEEPTWPRLFPATHPHASEFNDVIADSLSDIAKIYRGIGRPERAAAIYSYVADTRPEDVAAQLDYADYLLNPENPEHRDADRACVHAERAYARDPSDRRAAETFSAALFATGDVARAVAIQEEWSDREPPSGIVLNAEEQPRTTRSEG